MERCAHKGLGAGKHRDAYLLCATDPGGIRNRNGTPAAMVVLIAISPSMKAPFLMISIMPGFQKAGGFEIRAPERGEPASNPWVRHKQNSRCPGGALRRDDPFRFPVWCAALTQYTVTPWTHK